MSVDPFATAEVRERVLAGWAASGVRFREDANAEEDFALGGYRDRLVVELAQNAADAAVRARVPGRLLLALREWEGRAVLVAANTGTPVTGDGVQSLAALRASDKRDEDAIGHFGVGFSAVLAVSDEPALVSRSGGVRFSAEDSRALVAQVAVGSVSLAEELARRDGRCPVLRLPFPAQGTPPDGYDTAVLLPLRDAAAEDVVRRLLSAVDDALLLALPALVEVIVELPGQAPRRIAEVADRWHVVRRSGRLDRVLLADRPLEEQRRTAWSLAWALPRETSDAGDRPTAVVHAPTPTDEPLDWSALLIASFPLDSTRRRVQFGPATRALVAEAAAGYAALVADRARDGAPIWSLIPAGLARGELDGALREAVQATLAGTAILVPAERARDGSAGALLRPRDAVVLEPPAGADRDVVAGLAPVVAGLVLAPRSAQAALTVLGVRRLPLADLIEQLPLLPEPRWWVGLYAVLSPLAVDPLAREALAALPVPLADGRVVRGIRGLVLPPSDSADAEGPDPSRALAWLGVRLVDPAAVHPLLERLGASALDLRSALELPEVRAAVRRSGDEADPELVDAVLELVAAAVGSRALSPGDLPWLADLVLPDDEDEPAPAGALALPGSFAARVLDPDLIPPVDPDLAARWGTDVLAAVGVLDRPGLLRTSDVSLVGSFPEEDPQDGPVPEDLDGWQEWAEQACERVLAIAGDAASEIVLTELVALRDLDAVLDDAWPEVLDRIAHDPAAREAVLSPARVLARGVGRSVTKDLGSYTAWWLGRTLAGGPWADPDLDPVLAGLLPPPVPVLAGLDPAFRQALGAVRSLADLDPPAIEAVLAGLADPSITIGADTLIRLWRALAALAVRRPTDDEEIVPPAWIRVLDGTGTTVVPARAAVVVDGPAWLQRRDLPSVVLAPDPQAAVVLARLLDLPLAQDLHPGKVEPGCEGPTPVPSAVRLLLPEGPGHWCEHDELMVDGIEVDWWVEGRGPTAIVHASTYDGLARGLAWAAGQWSLRTSLSEVLTDPTCLAWVLADQAFD